MTRVFDDLGLKVRRVFPLFAWQKCEACKCKFRREIGCHTIAGPWHGSQGRERYLCGKCGKNLVNAWWIFNVHDNEFERNPPRQSINMRTLRRTVKNVPMSADTLRLFFKFVAAKEREKHGR